VSQRKTKVILTELQETKPETDQELEKLICSYIEKAHSDREKLKRVVMYAQTSICRWKTLIHYFGEQADFELCHHCDNCRDPVESRLQAEEKIAPASFAGTFDDIQAKKVEVQDPHKKGAA
ncbi:MAG: RecQ family zinc-binding domain-containing protein, partial [Bdellovibrionia bacterium]